jgi:hypothetical protein
VVSYSELIVGPRAQLLVGRITGHVESLIGTCPVSAFIAAGALLRARLALRLELTPVLDASVPV